jgi:hypothetical protein
MANHPILHVCDMGKPLWHAEPFTEGTASHVSTRVTAWRDDVRTVVCAEDIKF